MSHQTFWKPESRAAEKKAKGRKDDAAWRDLVFYVRARDGYRCRHCRDTFQVDPHHIKFRSAGGGDTKENVALLCRCCHDLVHGYRLAVSGNAENELRFEVLW